MVQPNIIRLHHKFYIKHANVERIPKMKLNAFNIREYQLKID